MTDYKAIHGKNIQSLASDLGAEGEGQIWFNTTSGDYKTIVLAAGAWSTGGNANTDRWNLGSLGIQTAAIMFGGQNPSPVVLTETYNGTAWTEGTDINTARTGCDGAGTSTAGLAFGGHSGTAYVGVAETWNGSTWTEVGDLNTGREVGGD